MNFNLKIQFLQEGKGEGQRDAQVMLNSDFEAPSLAEARAFGEEVSALFSEKYGFVPELYRPYETIVNQMGA